MTGCELSGHDIWETFPRTKNAIPSKYEMGHKLVQKNRVAGKLKFGKPTQPFGENEKKKGVGE